MKKKSIIKLMPYIVASSLILSGCDEQPSCDLSSNRHVHLYVRNINDDIKLSKYKESEEETDYYGFVKQDDLIDVNSEDALVYETMNNFCPDPFSSYTGLFDGKDNFDYLYYEMSQYSDYLEYYYEYETIETYTTTDSKGNVTVHTRTVTHTGWTQNKYDSDNTGKVRLVHFKYSAYRIKKVNGKYIVEESPHVDDIREVLDEYPYVVLDNKDRFYTYYKYNRHDLINLDVSDFYNENGHPDLYNRSYSLTKTK